MRCEQVEDLLIPVAELKEEERLRSIRDCEQEVDWWTNSYHTYETYRPQIVVDPLHCQHWVEGGDLRDGEEWKQVSA